MNTADELRTKTNFQNQELKERKIKRDNIKLYSINNDKQEDFDNHNISSDKKNENLVLLAEQNPYYIEFNRLLNSKKCVNIYVFIILLSLTIFIYSLVAYFKNLCNSFLMTSHSADINCWNNSYCHCCSRYVYKNLCHCKDPLK